MQTAIPKRHRAASKPRESWIPSKSRKNPRKAVDQWCSILAHPETKDDRELTVTRRLVILYALETRARRKIV